MLIETMTGNQNFPGMLAKAHVFVVPTRATPGKNAETHIFAAPKEGGWGVMRHSGGGRINAAEGMSDSLGSFNQTTYDVPDRTVLKLFASKKPQHSNETRIASQFLQLRADGPLIRLEVVLNDHPKATIRTAYVEGRFDLLTLEEAEALGARVAPLNRRQFAPQAVAALMNTRVIAPEIKAKAVIERKVVQNSEGERVIVEKAKSRRILDI